MKVQIYSRKAVEELLAGEFPENAEKTGERATLARSFSRTLAVKSRT